MKYVWDGRGTRGPSADCLIIEDEIRLRPKKIIRVVFGWPEVVLPRREIRAVEALFFGRHRYRSDNKLLDGACFRPSGQSKPDFLDALKTLGLPLIRPTKKEKMAFEFRNVWNQMRWGGRKGRRHWKREQHEPV
jgi:hypothetical protein